MPLFPARVRVIASGYHRTRRSDMLQHPAIMGLLAGLVTWGFTSLGAAAVFSPREFSRRSLDIMLGFAAGVMLAASFWSLLDPALELAGAGWGAWRFVPVAFGFLGGAVALRLLDILLPHLHPLEGFADGRPSRLPRSALLVLAITLHNIPEGLAVGVAFGASAASPEIGFAGAVTLMLGIGLQNLPEGMAVSVPLLREGLSRRRAFFYGQLSGIVEPIAAVIGAAAASVAAPILPWTLAFAAGAMVFVVVEEVVPEAQASGNGDAATMGVMLGFALMMCLDVAFG